MIESAEKRRIERRYQAGRVYYRPKSRHQVSSREDHIFAAALIFATGAAFGATVALMWGAV